MKKILVVGLTPNPGGMESFILNYYNHLNTDNIQFDFLANFKEPIAFEESFKKLGSDIYHLTPRSKNPIKFQRELNVFFRDNAENYDAIWLNVCSLANIDYLKMAKKYGIQRRIIHSHNSQNMDSQLRGWLHERNKKQIGHYATDFWACSTGAAQWFYNEDLLEKCRIIPNAIDLETIAFNETKRQAIRCELGWDDFTIIGNIGRLHFQKNQLFLIDLFYHLVKQNDQLRLVLVGQGDDRDKLEEKIAALQLQKFVKLVGVQKNIGDWLSAFDVFVFPSVFEGLPIAALEAQANGVSVLASTQGMDISAKINDNVILKSLDDPMTEWVAAFNKVVQMERINQNTITQSFEKAGFVIGSAAKKLEEELEK